MSNNSAILLYPVVSSEGEAPCLAERLLVFARGEWNGGAI